MSMAFPKHLILKESDRISRSKDMKSYGLKSDLSTSCYISLEYHR